MDEKQLIFEPVNQYDKVFRKQHDDNVKAKIEELIKKSGVNADENAETVRLIDAQKVKIASTQKILKRKRIFKLL